MAKLRITCIHSPIGYPEDQRLTLKSMGLKKLHQSVVKEDSQSLRGMIIKVRHLVTIEEASQ
ncbi:MAG: 50S ribosomal protein L30 [Dehalococcoidales bacterium]|nr:50S ribosomal protein L30 [Dehalococcoidales bacterium]MDD4229967.1 50S ribosomal protein L30 [Dehalococcoidales bacterium]MDD4465158.1 50S ribosomal protein L30 [Dehalococcoidales bacterium]MDD5401777.1 50S ribosomal protein L30 [Dehalococcoidales bacterium]